MAGHHEDLDPGPRQSTCAASRPATTTSVIVRRQIRIIPGSSL